MLRKVLFAIIVISFIFTANCQAQETSETESAPVVEESDGFFSSAKNFFGNLFSSENEEDTDENNDGFFSSAKSFFGGLFSSEQEQSEEKSDVGFFGSAKSFFSGLFSGKDEEENRSNDEVKRAEIEDFDDVSEDELAQAVVDYVNANPDKRDALINYAFNLQLIRLAQESRITDNTIREFDIYVNSIPLVGGFLVENSYDTFKEKYKQLLLDATTDNAMFMNAAKRYLENLTEHDRKIFVERNSPSEPETELYNAMMRIAAIRYRALEALIDENKARISIDISPLDLIDMFSYEMFSHDDDRATIERSKQAFEKIYEALWIDSEKMYIGGERFLKDYYAASAKEKVPQQLFPYNLESSWRPEPDEKIRPMKSDKSVKKARKRIYNMLKGEWTDLNDGTTCTINLSSENDDKPQEPPFEYPRMGSIIFLDEEQQFVSFYYRFNEKSSKDFFITPATYIDDEGNREDVLVLYEGYKLVNDDYKNTLENHRVENIKKAERVLIKPLK